jgi:hypothetical protein
MTGLKVGEVAKQADVNLQTIHYYERRGLLPKPPGPDRTTGLTLRTPCCGCASSSARKNWDSR